MRSVELVESEPGVMVKMDGSTSPVNDPKFLEVDRLLHECSLLKGCPCPDIRRCLRIHNALSDVSARHRLREGEVTAFLIRFRSFIKSEKLEPLSVLVVVGVIVCQGYYGVPLPLPSLRQSFFS